VHRSVAGQGMSREGGGYARERANFPMAALELPDGEAIGAHHTTRDVEYGGHNVGLLRRELRAGRLRHADKILPAVGESALVRYNQVERISENANGCVHFPAQRAIGDS